MLGGAATGAVASSAVVRATEPHFLQVHCRWQGATHDSGSRRRRNTRRQIKTSAPVPGARRTQPVAPKAVVPREPDSCELTTGVSTRGAAPSRSCDLPTTDLGNSVLRARAWCGLGPPLALT